MHYTSGVPPGKTVHRYVNYGCVLHAIKAISYRRDKLIVAPWKYEERLKKR